jgi:multisubunit Na+/H+ antiporter MnhF subunit
MSLFAICMSGMLAVVGISMVIAMARLLMGPSIPDRAMAFDTIMIHVVALIAIYAALVRQTILLDSIIIVAILGFLGTVALARFIEEGRN